MVGHAETESSFVVGVMPTQASDCVEQGISVAVFLWWEMGVRRISDAPCPSHSKWWVKKGDARRQRVPEQGNNRAVIALLLHSWHEHTRTATKQ